MSRGGTGVLWAGPVWSAGGYGEVARNYIIGLRRIGFPVRALNKGPDERQLLPDEIVRHVEDTLAAPLGPRPVGVIHGLPDPAFLRWRCRGVGRTVGCTLFETDSIPAGWAEACHLVDEVWVPTRFNLDTFAAAGVEPSRLAHVPYGIDMGYYTDVQERFPIPGLRRFSFLSLSFFDYRKGFDLLLDAYLREFSDGDDVSLVIKASPPPGWRPGLHHAETLRLFLGGRGADINTDDESLPHVVFMLEPLSQDQLRSLMATTDVYVSTERADGWGLPCHQAMAMGKPAMAIDWSGTTEFMTADNSLLIPTTGELEPVDPRLSASRPLYAGQKWAVVTTDAVRNVLRRAHDMPAEELGVVAARGRDHVGRAFSLEAAAACLRDRVLAMDVPDAPADAFGVGMRWEPAAWPQHLVAVRNRVRDVVRQRLGAAAPGVAGLRRATPRDAAPQRSAAGMEGRAS